MPNYQEPKQRDERTGIARPISHLSRTKLVEAALRTFATEIQLPKRVNDLTDKRFSVYVASKVLIGPATRAQEVKFMGNPT
jgi:hypothetical protein